MFTVSVSMTVWLRAMLFSVKWHNCQRFLLSCKAHWDRLFVIIMIIIIRRTCIQHKKMVCRTELSFISAPYTSQRCSEWSTGQHYCSWHPLLQLTFATMRRALLEQSIFNSMEILIDVGQNGAHSHNFFHHASVKLFGCLNTVTCEAYLWTLETSHWSTLAQHCQPPTPIRMRVRYNRMLKVCIPRAKVAVCQKHEKRRLSACK